MTVVLQPLLSVFALSSSNGNSGGACFVEGMDLMGKLLMPLMGPAFLIVVGCVLFLVARLREPSRQLPTEVENHQGHYAASILSCLNIFLKQNVQPSETYLRMQMRVKRVSPCALKGVFTKNGW